MAENLKVTHYNNGDEIPYSSFSNWCGFTGAMNGECSEEPVYTIHDIEVYGNLYNGWAQSDTRGICLEGWHIPTDAEWTTLVNYLGTDAGSQLAGVADLWNDGELKENSSFGLSGFEALPSGYIHGSTGIINVGVGAYFPSSTLNGTNDILHRSLDYRYTYLDMDYWDYSQFSGMPVRCLQDEITTGCTDPEACNYDETATADDGSCEFTSCDGTLLVPSEYSTIQSAIDASSDGDSVLVSAGTYYENIVIHNKDIFLIGEGAESTHLYNENFGGTGYIERIIDICEGSNVTVRGFDIYANFNSGLVTAIRVCGDDNSLSSAIIDRNLIRLLNATPAPYGQNLIQIRGSHGLNPDTKIINNTLEIIFYGFEDENGAAIRSNAIDINITNNIIIGGGELPLHFYGISFYGYYSEQYYSNIDLNTLNVFNNRIGMGIGIGWENSYGCDNCLIGLNGNISDDPILNEDYTLQPTSPCIDAGDPNSPLDPDGTIADMGAYYFHQESGCTDLEACNYDETANVDDGSCVYVDCAGVCDGPGVENSAGDGACCASGVIDCNNICDGPGVEDMCGVCDTDSSNDCVQDCAGVWGGDLELDCGDVCGGDNSTALSCCGLPFYDDCTTDCYEDSIGTCCIEEDADECGLCFGDGTSCCEDGETNNDNPCNPWECWGDEWYEIIIDCAEQEGVPCEGGIYVSPEEGECCSICVLYGDLNGDGTINVIDIVMVVDLILSNNYDLVGDVNEDGQLNVIDIVILVDWVLNGEPSICDGLTEVELWGEYYDIGTTTEIILSTQGLTGSIPSEIGCLTNLDELDLGNNQLTGEIPVEIGNLTNLWYLSLSDNQLTGEIPVEIGNLTSLTRLWLHANQLTGEIPPEIGNLTNFSYLSLANNQLTGEIPAEIGNLTNLTELYLGSNNLTGEIPQAVCDLLESNNLDIYDILTGNENLINTCEETTFCDGLTEVELWGEWYDIESTTSISLVYQGLTGEIPPEIGCLTNLTELDLWNNWELIGEIPTEIGNLTNLITLKLFNNELTGEIPPEVCDLIESNNLDINDILPGNNLINICD